MATTVLTSYKGGATKTTTSVSLASLFADEGQKVLLIDSDRNRHAKFWGRNGSLGFKVVSDVESTRVLTKEQFDQIIIDTPGRPEDDEIQELAESADLLILPVTPDGFALHLITQMVAILPKSAHYRVLIGAIPPAPQTDGADVFAALTEAGIPTFKRMIRAYKAYRNASTDGVPLKKAKPNGRLAWNDWIALRTELKELGL